MRRVIVALILLVAVLTPVFITTELGREELLPPEIEIAPPPPPPIDVYDPPVVLDKREWDLLYETDRSTPAKPDADLLNDRLAQAGLKLGAPVFIRIFKKEHVLEVWLKKGGKFQRFASYPICAWSGLLGPKLKEGDYQSPEGIYTVSKGQLNPNSQYYLSFNLGYPNRFDKAHERTGSYLMVHGNCVSIGCYAMTDLAIAEIWTLVTSAFDSGQGRFQVHAFPFRMTDENMLDHSYNEWAPFWGDLKKGYDLFEETQVPPMASVCEKRYQFREARTGSAGNHQLGARCVKTADGR